MMNSAELSNVGVDQQFSFADFASQALGYARRNATGQTSAAFGPAKLRIEVCGTVLSSVALDPLRHAAIETTVTLDFSLVMIDGKETGIDAPEVHGVAMFHDGRQQHDGNGARRSTFTVNEEWKTHCLIDADKRHAIVWFAD